MSPTSYALMEALRAFNLSLGQSARALAQESAWMPEDARALLRGWGEVTEQSFTRMAATPSWQIDGATPEVIAARPFGDLVHFARPSALPKRRILLIAPLSGHHATLLRRTVEALLPHADLFVTQWRNARDIPLSAGRFDVEDYTLCLIDFIRRLGPDLHVIAVCQPVPLALAATAVLSEDEPDLVPASLTLIGGPVDPAAAPTGVSDFGAAAVLGQLESTLIQIVPAPHAGEGRAVYPGATQLFAFMAMNPTTHGAAFQNQILAAAKGEAHPQDRHNRFYDEYLAVMDIPAEFYLSTVERIFQNREIARNAFTLRGTPVDLGAITRVPVLVIEGEKDDISAPGQCAAALPLLSGLAESKKARHLEPEAGHYGIFAGSAFCTHIVPRLLRFIDEA